MVENPRIATQPHLGRPEDLYKPSSKMQGYMAVAKVLVVHHKLQTADVQIINTSDIFSCPASSEGKHSPKISTPNSGFDPIFMTSWGTIEPMTEGQLVLLAFLDSTGTKPVIIGTLHDTEETFKNTLTSIYPLNEHDANDMAEALKYLKVFPCQSYHKVDGHGGIEHSHSSKTFLKMDSDVYNTISDTHGGYDHKNLSELDQVIKRVREGRTEASMFPLNILFCHRSNFEDSFTTWTKFFLDKFGMARLTRDNNDGTLSYYEVAPGGSLKSRRQIDSDIHGLGENYSESIINSDGSISVVRNIQGELSEYNISVSGELSMVHPTGSFIKLDNNGDILIKSARYVKINEGM